MAIDWGHADPCRTGVGVPCPWGMVELGIYQIKNKRNDVLVIAVLKYVRPVGF